MPPIIGIPQTLAYYTFYPFWRTFFSNLGCEVISSHSTNRQILDGGVEDTVNDACVPIKLYHGHALALRSKADYIFCPRLISADGRSTFCPKFLGLPDMVRYSRSDLPPLITTQYDIRKFRPSALAFCRQIATTLGISQLKAVSSYARALKTHRHYRRLLLSGLHPENAIAVCEGKSQKIKDQPVSSRANIAVVGFPYIIYDRYVTVDLLGRLIEMNIQPHTPDMISDPILNKHRSDLPLDYFWFYSNRVARSSMHYLQRNDIDGLIHVTAFGCGPDSMLNRIIELQARTMRKPQLTVTIDEHTGEGGIVTRLEAFIDMLVHKKSTSGFPAKPREARSN